jgi:hypothetical protein
MGSWGVIQLTWLHYRPINTTPKAIKNSSNIITTDHGITIAFSKYTPPSVLPGTFGAHRGASVKLFPDHTSFTIKASLQSFILPRKPTLYSTTYQIAIKNATKKYKNHSRSSSSRAPMK